MRLTVVTLAFGVLTQAAVLPAFAALGADVASVEADRAHMKGELRATATERYQLHEILLPSGTRVREYVSAAGKVFAVSWHGPTMPDLRQTLGDYYDKLQAARGAARGDHHHLSVEQPEFVLHSRGHQRSFAGQAYIPALLPAGVTVADIR